MVFHTHRARRKTLLGNYRQTERIGRTGYSCYPNRKDDFIKIQNTADMKIIRYPELKDWSEIFQRPHLDVTKLNKTVNTVLADIKSRGDEAVKDYELQFDHAHL